PISSPSAHSAAETDDPVRQAMWGVIELLVDTLIICTVTALVVIVSGVWKHEDAADGSVREALTARAFGEAFGPAGSTMVSLALILFVFSTITVVVFYGSRQAEYLFGFWAGTAMKTVYVISIIIGAIGGAATRWTVLDSMPFMILLRDITSIRET